MKPVSAAEGELERMYVRPQWRGRGFGRRVFDQLVQDARSLGLQRLRLETFSFMEAAIGMYRASGFVETQPFDGFEGEKRGIGDIEVFMSLDLT